MKKICIIFMAFCMLFPSACGTVGDPAAGNTVQPEESGAVYPLTVIDQMGRQVTLKQEPERIVSSYYISSSLLIALGLQDRMVGIETNPEKRPIYALSAPELLDLTCVGSVKDFDLEACLSVQPDLVILPTKLKDLADKMEELGIPVLYINPESEALLLEAVELVGAACGASERAKELAAYIASVKKTLVDSLVDAQPCTVYLGGNSSFFSTAGSKMYQSSMITLAGGINAAQEIEDTYWAEVSYEQILAWNPDVILLASDASYPVEDILNDKNLASCKAVKEGRVYHMPSDVECWDSPVPGSVLGSLWLAGILYPDCIMEEQVQSMIGEFYETFFGFQP